VGTIEELISKLGDTNRIIRQNAERELVKTGVPVVNSLIHALEDDDWPVRYWMSLLRVLKPFYRMLSTGFYRFSSGCGCMTINYLNKELIEL